MRRYWRKFAANVPLAIRARSGKDILETWGEDRPAPGGKVCLFSHWDKHGVIDDYVIHYLSRIADHGYRVDLVATSDHLEPEGLRKARKVCRRVILRRNAGLDFASWKDAARDSAALGDYEHLLLANDSVFGPFRDLGPILARMEREPASMWGMTDSNQGPYHLQSYFLHLSRDSLRSRAFRGFWRRVVPLADKIDIILRYEVGFSRKLARAGGTLRAAFPVAAVEAITRAMGDEFPHRLEVERWGMNSTVHAWDILFRDLGFPFIKTAVLKESSSPSKALGQWPDVIPPESRGLVDVIARYLRRAHPKSAALQYVPA